MKLQALSCSNCAAPLAVPPRATYVTCAHCGSRLLIHRTPDVAYTEVLADLDRRTQRVEAEVDDLQLRAELADLDRAWEEEIQQYVIIDRYGVKHLPIHLYSGSVVFLSLLILVVGVIAVIMLSWVLAVPSFVWLSVISLIFVTMLIAMIATARMMRKADAYRRAEAQYQQQRRALYARYGCPPDA